MIQTLVSSGHRFVDIKGYTIAQVLMFHAAALRYLANTRANNVVDNSVAQHAKPDARIEFINKLHRLGSL